MNGAELPSGEATTMSIEIHTTEESAPIWALVPLEDGALLAHQAKSITRDGAATECAPEVKLGGHPLFAWSAFGLDGVRRVRAERIVECEACRCGTAHAAVA